ncbi:hypothetical protein CHGG_01339 [Chaetomium globosum CBS 148.51]|uniref:Cytochrome P450 monooxygenase n=1 Tax=Chaetomium globosum (strain ATCC 6205 / CBS 148.51 / DSM 1962 / NBRC 6347 / NRRL 1970) TaxID=306901 RepID=Q2HEL5_CHAGB|nr:uncharacterized protein CHGG_01339 [Chaetomium globosum CBS 148.51]EAQ93104.1 hypothetical protein CHGG_01339 [Chaetomium globosum CBS 148.51]
MPVVQDYYPSGFIPFVQDLPAQYFVVLGLFTSLLVVSNWTTIKRTLRKFWLRRQGYFQDNEGRPIPELKGETRFSRFSHGYELSLQGAKTAERRPYMIWNGTSPEVVLTQAEHVREFYSKRSQEHFKPENASMGHYFGRVMGVCAGVQNGAVWKNIRKVFDPYFSYKSAQGFSEIYAAEFKKWMDDLSAGRESDFVAEATTICTVLPFKLIALACYGPALDGQGTHDGFERSGLYNALPTASKKDMDTFEADWKKFNFFMMRESEEKQLPCPIREMYKDVLAGTITEANWLQTIDEILFTNLDVTSAILAFLLINLGINQPVQSELRSEITRSLATPIAAPGIDSSPIEEYIRKTDTLLRIHLPRVPAACAPRVWFTLPEYVGRRPSTLAGYRIQGLAPCLHH